MTSASSAISSLILSFVIVLFVPYIYVSSYFQVEQEIPSLLLSAQKKTKTVEKKNGDEPEKKKKKKDKTEKPAEVEDWPVEKGAFRKIFYKPSEATVNRDEKNVKEFQEKHKMNLTGRLVELFKPIEVKY